MHHRLFTLSDELPQEVEVFLLVLGDILDGLDELHLALFGWQLGKLVVVLGEQTLIQNYLGSDSTLTASISQLSSGRCHLGGGRRRLA